jgi:hypothetical protein
MNEGVSWGFHVGKKLVKLLNDNDEVWVISNSAGASGFTPVDLGTGLSGWDKDTPNLIHNYYTNMENRVNDAIIKHNLKPIALLWQQGEFDAGRYMPSSLYQRKLDTMFVNFRNFLKNKKYITGDLPVIVGQMGLYYNTLYPQYHTVHLNIGKRLNNSATAQNQNTYDQHIGDLVHFTADAHRDMGGKYLDALLSLKHNIVLRK